MIVTIGDHAVFSDSAGHFQIDGSGETILARAPGYRAAGWPIGNLGKEPAILRLTPFTPKALYSFVYEIGSKTLRNGVLQIIQHGSANAVVIDMKSDRARSRIPLPFLGKKSTVHER